jgi:dipeptidyl-peptidase 4
MASRFAALAIGIAALTGAVGAQAPQRSLTIDLIYDPQNRINFSGTAAPDITWIDADTYLQVQRAGSGADWLKVDAVSGRTTPLFDRSRMESAIAALPGIQRDDAAAAARSGDLTLNPSRTAALFAIDDDLYWYEFASNRAARLTSAAGVEEEASFSPDGQRVAFVRSHNLFVVDVAARREQALTSDGSSEILNGKLDWLYQEEIYGRGRFRAYWWSPDSQRIAFLQLNERPVPEYTVVDHIPYRPELEVTDYPKAGDANPTVKLGLAPAAGGAASWVDLSAYASSEFLIVNVGWSPARSQLVFQAQDREQTWLDLNVADPASGKPRRVLRETTKAWVNENGNPVWLKDGSFLWFSERSGFKHLYHYRADGTQVRQITSGGWDVRSLYGVNESAGAVYFSSGARRHIDTDVYRIGLDGSSLTRLSRTDGTHAANFNPAFTRYVDRWSDIATPAQVRLHAADGSELRVISGNRVQALGEFALSTPEFVEIKARDGFPLDGMIIRPPNFDPSRRYPVYQLTYAGPTAASVRNQWGGSTYLFHQLLAQHDIVVWILDNRSAGGRGAESQWPVYGNFGEPELRDLEDGIEWLKHQPYIDSSRIVLSGWSFGGFMTAYALTHSTSWSGGVVGAPVTDWRDYDSVYTERYMKTPAHNPEGYRKSAPRFAAANLHGRMLLLHGSMDDNVHMQNSVQFIYELQRAGKSFEMMLYPRSRHGIADPRLNLHLQRTIFDFVMRTVMPEPDAASTARQSR